MAYDAVTIDHSIMGGVPCISGTRIPVEIIVGMLAEDMTEQEILAAYPQLTPESIRVSLRYAAASLRVRERPLLATA